jgi:leucyl aminopeptidase (aminopeptidase T)
MSRVINQIGGKKLIEINYFQEAAEVKSFDVRAMRAVKRQINERVKVKPGEHVLITADFATEKEMIEAFASAVVEAGGIPTIVIMPNSGWSSWPLEVTPIAQNAIMGADVMICCERTFVLWWGLPHGWQEELAKKGKKIRVMEGSEQTWKYHGVFDIDREEMEKYYDTAKRIARVIETGKKVRVTSKGGTDITSEIYGGGCETWMYLQSLKNPEVKPSAWMWEGGVVNGCEVDIAVAPGTAEGVVVWDGPVAFVRSHGEPIKLTVNKGRIVAVEGGKDALIFERLLARIKNMDQIVEMAAGLTPGWMPDGSVHGEKRGLGNCHVACGGWYPHLMPPDFVQPKPYLHVDGTVYRGTMEIDGKKVIEEGKVYV